MTSKPAPGPEPAQPPSSPPRIVLVGMMGSGKSTVGQLLAERLGWEYRDSDADVETTTGV